MLTLSLTVHLNEELVESVLPLIVTSETSGRSSLTPHSINLINEYNTRGIFTSLTEEVANPGRAHAHKHLEEL